MRSPDVVVVGGGIAALSAARALAPERQVLLLEREPVLCTHASGRNAAMFRPLEDDRTTAPLAARTLTLCEAFMDTSPVALTGMLLVAPEAAPIDALHRHARTQGVACEALNAAAATQLAPSLRDGHTTHALWLPSAGVIDIHALTSALAQDARTRGVELRTHVGIERLLVRNAKIAGVQLDDGTRIDAKLVVLAAGAWSAQLAAAIDAPLPLTPVRRHLVQLAEHGPCTPSDPIVWQLGEAQLYYRPEGDGVLASPGDATPWQPEDPPADPDAAALLARKLAPLAPHLITNKIRRHWACLRTFAPDGELVIGPDPRIEGLAWLCGLGGRGMAVGVAAGELLADLCAGKPHPLADVVVPTRLC